MNKESLIKVRGIFFNDILSALTMEATPIDKILNQEIYYIPILNDQVVKNVEYGDLGVFVRGEFFNIDFQIYYTIWQTGNLLKVGVAIKDQRIQGAFASDEHNEVDIIWGDKNKPSLDVARGCIFYDWSFDATNLYDSYQNQERFILGIRHMHFRVMRIIYDECHKISLGIN